MSSKKLLDPINVANYDYLNKTFKNSNKFYPEIRPTDYQKIQSASNSNDLQPNSTLPKELFSYLVRQISQDCFKNGNN